MKHLIASRRLSALLMGLLPTVLLAPTVLHADHGEPCVTPNVKQYWVSGWGPDEIFPSVDAAATAFITRTCSDARANGVYGADVCEITAMGNASNGEHLVSFRIGNQGYGEFVNDICDSPQPGLMDNAGPQNCRGNPINITTGNKLVTAADYESGLGLILTRYYQPSRAGSFTALGSYWRTSFDRALLYFDVGAIPGLQENSVTTYRPNGETHIFVEQEGIWTPWRSDIPETVERLMSGQTHIGWTYKTSRNEIETYDTGGKLLSIVDTNGRKLTLTYDPAANDQIETVSDEFGHVLTFNYPDTTPYLVESVTDPAGNEIVYGYDADKNLETVLYPGETTPVTYLYNEVEHVNEGADLPHALTGIINERGERFATYKYDTEGRAYSSQHGQGRDYIHVDYSSEGTRTVTDGMDNQNVYAYSMQERQFHIDSVGSPCADCGSAALKTYDAAGFVESTTDFVGNMTTYGRNSRGLADTVTIAANSPLLAQTTTTIWHPDYYLPELVTAPSVGSDAGDAKVTDYDYTPEGWPERTTMTGHAPATPPPDPALPDPEDRVSQTFYCPDDGIGLAPESLCPASSGYVNSAAQIDYTDGPRTDVDDFTRYEYHQCTSGGKCGRLKKIVQPVAGGTIQLVTQFLEYDGHGRVKKMIEPNGAETTFVYTLRGKLESSTVSHPAEPGVQRVTSYTYYPNNLLETVTSPIGAVLTYYYDDAHYLTEIRDEDGNRVEYGYDANGNRTKEYSCGPAGDCTVAGNLYRKLDLHYDPADHLDYIEATTALNEVSITDFDFDDAGRLREERDPNQVAAPGVPVDPTIPPTINDYDELGRLKWTTNPLVDIGTGLPGRIDYGYDVHSNVTSITVPNGAQTLYHYDDFGQLLREVSPDRGTIDYTYDAAGNRKTVTDARPVTATYHYDELNRLTWVDFPDDPVDGDLDVQYFYDEATSSYGLGRLTRRVDAAGTTVFDYDILGNVITETRTVVGLTFTTNYEYDLAGNLTAIVYPQTTPGDPARRRVDYIRDNLGRIDSIVSSITTIGLPQTVASAIDYLPFGPFDTLTYGNGLVLTRDYDLAYRLEAQTITGVDSLDWVLDKAGNIDDLNRDGNLLQDFSYDVIHRLDDESGDYGERDYVYDENANRESVIYDGGPTTEALTYDPGTNRIATRDGVALAYDPAGNMTFDGLDRDFAYNVTGRLQSVTQAGQLRASYTYDALGRRIVKTLPDQSQVLYHYDLGGQLLAEHHLAGSKVTEYVYFGAMPVAQFEQGALVDTDGDGVDDAADNCIDDQNVTQCDTNADGWGNHCDADLDNNLIVNFVDLQILKDRMFAQGEDDADLNCDLIINFTDLQIMRERMFGPPGPSGLNGELGQGAVVYLHPDQLGTPRGGSDVDGTVVWRWGSDAFGVGAPDFDVDGNGDPTTVNLRFPGQYFDAESGLHYNFHRYYDPLVGRYITSDPIGLAGGPNSFLYAGANPITQFDPDGEFVFVLFLGPSAAAVLADLAIAGGAALYLSQHSSEISQAIDGLLGSQPVPPSEPSDPIPAVPPSVPGPAVSDVLPDPTTALIPEIARFEEAGECDEIDCLEWMRELNKQYAQISFIKRRGGDTALVERQHNRSVDMLCRDRDCGYLCHRVNRF